VIPPLQSIARGSMGAEAIGLPQRQDHHPAPDRRLRAAPAGAGAAGGPRPVLGAAPLATFRRVTLPPQAPGLFAAFLLSFSLSFDDDVISRFTAGETVTLPLNLAGAFRREIAPRVQVLASLVLLVSAALLALGLRPGPQGR